MAAEAAALPHEMRSAEPASASPNEKLTATIRHLRIDGDKQAFFDNAAANALLSHEHRVPFVVPRPGEI